MSSSRPRHDRRLPTPPLLRFAKQRVRGQAGHARTLTRRYLRFGTRSAAEVRAYLVARQIAEPLIRTLIPEWTREGLLDDRACATLWANRLADQGYAWEAIRQRLLEKGLDDHLVTDVLIPLQRVADDEARARLLVSGRVATLRAPDRGQTGRVARWLAQRGFDSDLIGRVLAESSTSPSHDE